MVKNSFISVIFQEKKEEKRGSVDFQIVSFTNKIRRLTSHLELHKKTIHLREVYEKFWENINGCFLTYQRKIEYAIMN